MAPQPAPLQIGERRRVRVDSRTKWNHTGVLVSAGEHYAFETEGTWSDMGIRRDGNGFASGDVLTGFLLKPHEAKRRAPLENWFCLIGGIGEDPTKLFRIGRQSVDWPVGAGMSGELTCFANDVGWAYWNNIGSITLSITRTS